MIAETGDGNQRSAESQAVLSSIRLSKGKKKERYSGFGAGIPDGEVNKERSTTGGWIKPGEVRNKKKQSEREKEGKKEQNRSRDEGEQLH